MGGRPLNLVSAGRLRGLPPLESQIACPREGGWSAERRSPVPPVARGERVVVHFITRGKRIVNYVFRMVRRDALLVLGELVSAAAASVLPFPTPRLIRSR